MSPTYPKDVYADMLLNHCFSTKTVSSIRSNLIRNLGSFQCGGSQKEHDTFVILYA